MKKLLIAILFIGLQKSNAQIHKFKGTWINIEFCKALLRENSDKSLDSIIPRCIYIDSSNRVTIEYRYEQKSSSSLIKQIYTKDGNQIFNALNRTFTLINDSVIVLSNYGHNIYFKKLNSEAIIGDGLQALLRKHFWSNYKKWQLISVTDGQPKDSTIAFIHRTRINGIDSNPLFKPYEFLDTKQYKEMGENLFGIDFYRVNNNKTISSGSIFGIKKNNNKVYLYKDNSLKYVLSPIE